MKKPIAQTAISIAPIAIFLAGCQRIYYGRLRTVAEDRNGYLYVSTSNGDGYGSGQPGQDVILRLSPVR